MVLSLGQLREIQSKLFAKIAHELEMANKYGNIDAFLEKYGVQFDEEERMPINTRTYKILVIGELAGRLVDYQTAAKRMGIRDNNIEYISYEEAKCINVERLRNSTVYSDIIVGPMPHKIAGMGDTSSFVALIENNPKEYPKMIKSTANSESNQLKISVTSFKECLEKTQYYEELFAE